MSDELQANVYYEEDVGKDYLEDKKVGVIGYGSQGRGQALNLKDSGYNVSVGLREGSDSREKAKEQGLEVGTVEEVAEESDVVQLLVPDNVQPEVYHSQIEDNLEEGDALFFSHGFNVHYDQINPPKNVDVVMVAPKSPGHLLRRKYTENSGVPCLLAVERNYTGEAKELGLSYAHAIGGTRAGVIETTFKEETESDLFGEQAVLCGGVTELVKTGFETLVENGYQPEMAYFEVLNELKLIVDLMFEGGLEKMWDSVSDTAEYGGLSKGEKVITEQSREGMENLLEEVQNGNFAKEWINENKANRPHFKKLVQEDREHQIEEVGTELRDMIKTGDGRDE